MAYGLLYKCTFDPITAPTTTPVYTIDISLKGYTGSASNVKGAAIPCVQSYQTDEPTAPIKGCSLNFTLINEGSLPLTSFYHQDDDGFKVQLYWGTQLMFEGFLVQDDCNETFADFAHEINLSATDNLGLLKKLALNESPANYDIVFSYVGQIATLYAHAAIVDNTFGSRLAVGSKIRILGTTVDGTYTIASLFYDPTNNNWGLTFVEIVSNSAGPETGTLSILTTFLYQKIKITSILKTCLLATGLQLNTKIFCNVWETSQVTTDTTFAQTLIDPQSFLKDETTYQDCYTILTAILTRFECTLFQAKGAWYIIKWSDLRYYNSQVPGFSYDPDFLLTGSIVLDEQFNAKPYDITNPPPTFPHEGLYRKILRPYNYDKETFNFAQQKNLLRNANLQELGPLIRTYTTGSGVDLNYVFEYQMPWWNDSPRRVEVAEYFIRVTFDVIHNEISRYAVIKNDNVESYKIEANAGDIFSLSFNVKTIHSGLSGVTVTFLIELNDGAQTKILRTPWVEPFHPIHPLGWYDYVANQGWIYDYGAASTNESTNIIIQSPPIPFDGLLTINLNPYPETGGFTPNFEAQYSDIRFSYTYLINESTKITGQIHQDKQIGVTVKNNNSSEITVDTSPRNTLAGTLFLPSLVGLLQKRAAKFKRGTVSESLNLGNITTFEEQFRRRLPRTILEGTMTGLTNAQANTYGVGFSVHDNLDGTQTVTYTWTSMPAGTVAVTVSYLSGTGWHDSTGAAVSPRTYDMPLGTYQYRIKFELGAGGSVDYYLNPTPNHVSILSVFKYSYLNNLNFVFGKLDIDYRNNSFTSTMWEQYKDSEVDADLTQIYNFEYIYSPK